MNVTGLVFFGIFLLVMIVLIIAMFVSLTRLGDERRQMIVWKASTAALCGTMGALVIGIVESMVKVEDMRVNPFVILAAAAVIYFVFFLYYKKKYGN